METQTPIWKHLAGAVEPAVAAAAAAEMRGHFARFDAPAGYVPSKRAGAGWQPQPSVSWHARAELRPRGSSRPGFTPGPAVRTLLEAVTGVLAAQFPEEFTRQARLPQEPEPEAFNTITVNRNWPTPPHCDSGTRAGSLVALLVVKEGAVVCPTRFELADGPRELELESGDLVLYQGAEIAHGNPAGVQGKGTRWAFIFFAG